LPRFTLRDRRPDGRCSTEMAVPVHAQACPSRRLVSVALFLGFAPPAQTAGRDRRTAVSRYRALWSPDLPRRALRRAAIARSALRAHCKAAGRHPAAAPDRPQPATI